MSGFNSDIVSILIHNNLYHRQSIGWVVGTNDDETFKLFQELERRKLLVSPRKGKHVLYDYIVIGGSALTTKSLISALTTLSKCGIIVLDIRNKKGFEDKAVSLFGEFTATKVKYDTREYLIIHAGVDYGN